ncbi:response regulator [Pelotomaculum propionicicum]|uniref:response regulator n=1 Tax=Pelotomaculum propionicicum TaxID=258475 RepID=UPI003B7E2826
MKKRIMIVDDSNFARMMLKKILTGQGYEVVGDYGNGIDAVAEYQRLNPDLVTLDIVMPEMGGKEALHKILSMDPQAKVVIVSSLDVKESILGAQDFVLKPFTRERLLQAVEKALSSPADTPAFTV